MALTAVDLSQASKRIAVPTLAHDLILSDPTQSVGNRAGVSSLSALKGIIGGFAPATLGSATVSAQVSTWRATSIVIPATLEWILLRIDLPVHRGLYLLHGGQWRALPPASPGSDPTEAQTIPLAGGLFYDTRVLLRAGRAGGDNLLVGYDGAESGAGTYDVEIYQL